MISPHGAAPRGARRIVGIVAETSVGSRLYGVPQDDIALVVGIGSRNLRKHFRNELDVAMIESEGITRAIEVRLTRLSTSVTRTTSWKSLEWRTLRGSSRGS